MYLYNFKKNKVISNFINKTSKILSKNMKSTIKILKTGLNCLKKIGKINLNNLPKNIINYTKAKKKRLNIIKNTAKEIIENKEKKISNLKEDLSDISKKIVKLNDQKERLSDLKEGLIKLNRIFESIPENTTDNEEIGKQITLNYMIYKKKEELKYILNILRIDYDSSFNHYQSINKIDLTIPKIESEITTLNYKEKNINESLELYEGLIKDLKNIINN